MTELEKAIARQRDFLLRSVEPKMGTQSAVTRDMYLILTAASSWAALVWRKGTEIPTKAGHYEVANDKLDPTAFWFFGGKRWEHGPPDWWRDLSGLPPVPEATDE